MSDRPGSGWRKLRHDYADVHADANGNALPTGESAGRHGLRDANTDINANTLPRRLSRDDLERAGWNM